MQTQKRIEMLEKRLRFDYTLNNYDGQVVVYGLEIPSVLFGQIWTGIRKEIRKKCGVDVVGLAIFTEQDVMRIQLIPNVAVAENRIKSYITKSEKRGENLSLADKEAIRKTELNNYFDTFRLSFFNWINLIEEVIDCFLLDFTNGYEPYLDALEKNAPDNELEAMIDRFLESINLRDRKVS